MASLSSACPPFLVTSNINHIDSNSNNDNDNNNDDNDMWSDLAELDMTNLDEQRHALRQEVTETQESIKLVKSDIKKEDLVRSDHNKNVQKSREEMDNFIRAADDLKGKAEIGEEHRQALDEALRTEIMVDNDHILSLLSPNNGNNADNDKENAVAATPEFTTPRTFLLHQSARLEKFHLLTNKSALIEIQTKATEIQGEIAVLQQTIQSEDLIRSVDTTKAEADACIQELTQEETRKAHVRQSILVLQAQTEEQALQVAVARNKMDDDKILFASELETAQNELKMAEMELANMKSKDAWSEEITKAEKELIGVTNAFAEAEKMLAQEQAARKERESIEASLVEIHATEKQVKLELEMQQKELSHVEADLVEAQKVVDAVQAEVVANDKYENETVLPAKAELEETNAEKRNMTKSIDALNTEAQSDDANHKDKTAKETAELEALDEELNVVQEAHDFLVSQINAMHKSNVEESGHLVADIEGLNSELAGVIILKDEQQRKVDAAKKQAHDAAQTALKDAKKEMEQANRHKAILESGVELLALVANHQKEQDQYVQDLEASCRNDGGNGTNLLSPTQSSQTADKIFTQLDRKAYASPANSAAGSGVSPPQSSVKVKLSF